MRFEGTYSFHKKSAEVYAYVVDLKRVSECIPDLKSVDVKSEKEALATVRAGIGFIKGDFTLRFTVTQKSPPNMVAYAVQGSGLGSGVDMSISVSLNDSPTSGSTMHWVADTKIVGRIASMAQGMINSQAEKIIKGFFDCLGKRLG
jgi:carbon monoxide dehydrogenase subunit G